MDFFKGLIKIQGMILIEMIECEFDMLFFEFIKDFCNGFIVFYWNMMGSFFGYDIKEGYVEGKDFIFDFVFCDMNISYEILASCLGGVVGGEQYVVRLVYYVGKYIMALVKVM